MYKKTCLVLAFMLLAVTPYVSEAQSKRCALPKETFGGKTLVGVVTQSTFSIDKGQHRYDFVYRLPNGSQIKSWVEFDIAGTKVEVGDLHLWLPANEKVRSSFPAENRHVPILMKRLACEQVQLDFSRAASEIPIK